MIGTSCVSSKKHDDLMAERDAVQNRLDKSNADKDELNAQITEMESMQSKLKTEVANGQRDLDLTIYHWNLVQLRAVRQTAPTRAPETDNNLGF